MRSLVTWTVPVLLGLVGAGCNTLAGAPEIERAAIEPEMLNPGDSAVITLAVEDRNAVVHHIEGVVQEDPRIQFELRNDGEGADEKAGDNIWSMRVDVPFQAPEGDYAMEFTAYRADGLPVEVRTETGDVVPLKTAIPLKIRYENAGNE